MKVSSGRINENLIKELLQKYLPKYKLPDHFLNWPDTELTAGYKPDRVLFKKIALEEIAKKR